MSKDTIVGFKYVSLYIFVRSLMGWDEDRARGRDDDVSMEKRKSTKQGRERENEKENNL